MKVIYSTLILLASINISIQSFAQKTQNEDSKVDLTYQLSMPKPQTHYFKVKFWLTNLDYSSGRKQGYIDFKLPVWTPGSYLIREYAKNIEGFAANDDETNKALDFDKINKNTWRVKYSGQKSISVSYDVYAFELSVRTSFLDESHGYLNGASVFMFVNDFKNKNAILNIIPFERFKTITTGLSKGQSENSFLINDYDQLVDSPIEIGNQKILKFQSSNIPHTVAMYGETKYDEAKLLTQMKLVTETATKIVGEHPCKDYFFLVHNVTQGGGGLEHKNSTTLGVSRNAYLSASGMTSFLSLVAHEYFHLWNVKRIRPIALGPFDYENENYTHALWVAEGLTSYYQNHILQRAGIISTGEYLTGLEKEITSLENSAGQKVQAVTESSWDAWIKHYRPNENSKNATISYYDKGAVLGILLDLTIIDKTNGTKCLDDVMKMLYEKYYKKLGRGYSDDELLATFNEVSGTDLTQFFKDYIFGTMPLPYSSIFETTGIKMVSYNLNDTYIGVETKITDNKLIVSAIKRDSPAWDFGLNVNDEILSIDEFRVTANVESFQKLIQSKKANDTLKIGFVRDGMLKELNLVLATNKNINVKLEQISNPSENQQKRFTKWQRK